jgi:hypothetical protein
MTEYLKFWIKVSVVQKNGFILSPMTIPIIHPHLSFNEITVLTELSKKLRVSVIELKRKYIFLYQPNCCKSQEGVRIDVKDSFASMELTNGARFLFVHKDAINNDKVEEEKNDESIVSSHQLSILSSQLSLLSHDIMDEVPNKVDDEIKINETDNVEPESLLVINNDDTESKNLPTVETESRNFDAVLSIDVKKTKKSFEKHVWIYLLINYI